MNAADWWPALDRAGFHVLRVLLSVLWQSSVLLGAVGLIAWALRRRRASVRHVVWTAALLVAPFLPLIGWIASTAGTPQAEIRVVPSYAPVPVARLDFEDFAPASPSPAFTPGTFTPTRPEQSAPSPLSYPWALALIGYAGGAAFLLTLVNVGRIRLRRWVRNGSKVTDPRVVRAFGAAQERFRIKRSFVVIESTDAHAPMTIGTLRPAILLPMGLGEGLSDAELEAVAIHEVAHVRRKDALLLTMLSFVRALLFFHPLVWLGCRQVSALAESACDDAVLDATGEPLSYAKMLARLAEGLPRRMLSTELAAGIVVSKSAFLKRVTEIVSERRDRIRKLSKWALAATVIAGVGSVVLAAGLPLKERAELPEEPRLREERVFGPVIERVVNPSDDKKDRFIDLDAGKLFDAPESKMSLTELKTWTAERGIDAVADGVLGGFEMLVFPAEDSSVWDWETIPEGEMLRNLTEGEGGTPVPIHAEGGFPATWFFKTREGSIGILQIVDYPKKPAGPGVNPYSIKIRYKLLGARDAAREAVEKIRKGSGESAAETSSGKGRKTLADLVALPLRFQIRTVTPDGKAAAGVRIRCLHPRAERGEALIDKAAESNEEGIAEFVVTKADIVRDRYFWFSVADERYVGSAETGISPLEGDYQSVFTVYPAEGFEFRITTEDGKPIAGGELRLTAVGRGRSRPGPTVTAPSDAKGYTSARFADVPVEVSAASPGYAPGWFEVDVLPQERPYEITLRPGHPIHGRVVDLQQNPVEGATVAAVHVGRRGVSKMLPTQKTDAEGKFTFEDVAEGSCEILASFLETPPHFNIAPARVEVGKGIEKSEVVLVAKPAAALRGKHVRKHGFRVNNNKNLLGAYSTNLRGVWGMRLEDDSFVISGIPVGPQEQGFIQLMNVSGFYPQIEVPGELEFLKSEGGMIRFSRMPAGTHDGLVITYLLEGRALGKIVDSAGEPLPGLRVVCWPAEVTGSTDSRGGYNISVPPNREVRLVFQAPKSNEIIAESESFMLGEGEVFEKDFIVGRGSEDAADEALDEVSGGGAASVGSRDDLLGWYEFSYRSKDGLLPVFRSDGVYYSACMGVEVPLEECPEGLERSNITIGFDSTANAHFMKITDPRTWLYAEGSVPVEKRPMTKTVKPSWFRGPMDQGPAERPETNDDFLGWYQFVWQPCMRAEIRREGERYFLATGYVDESGAWKPDEGLENPAELTPIPDALGFAVKKGLDLEGMRIVYDESLKHFELIREESSSIFRAPLTRVSEPPTGEGAAAPTFVSIGLPRIEI